MKSKAFEDPILGAMARLTLQSAQQHKVWEAILLDTYLCSSTAPTILAAREAGRLYHLEFTGQRWDLHMCTFIER